MRSIKDDLTAKKKSLTIHINTDHIGPHGMPLVYGSTADRIGSIKGLVCFSSNYDCKGRDIQIIYEAWTESHWTAIENKRLVHHHSREVFGHQTWSLPLVHTKHNGSTVVAGVYEKEFEVPLALTPSPMQETVRRSMESTISTSTSKSSSISSSTTSSTRRSKKSSLQSPSSSISSITSSSPSSSTSSLTSGRMTLLPPSSSYGTNTKIKYTIRAVLQRPFPSLSNVEASQEIWVVNSAPVPPPSYIHASASADPTALSSPRLTTSQLVSSPLEESKSPRASLTVGSEDDIAAATINGSPSPSPLPSPMKPQVLMPMPSTPYGGQQFVVFFYYFCTLVLGLGFCNRYCPRQLSAQIRH